ncbi:hypothetical protein I317_06587 [Kwoniella heveanensis CBS 569]|nr:hypothetical protein I317_06587 [Kwoniella heveanensis CBS 569]
MSDWIAPAPAFSSKPSRLPRAPLEWPCLVRDRRHRDPAAPNAPSRLSYALITYLAYTVYLLILPIYVPYLVFQHYSTPRPFDSWTLSKRLNTRLGKLQVWLVAWWIPPTPKGWDADDDWSWPLLPTSGSAGGGGAAGPLAVGQGYLDAHTRGLIDIEVVKLRAVDREYIRGFADVEGVSAEDRPGIWITPKAKGSAVDGSEGGRTGVRKAKKGEKVILHIHGGGYIRGHPLWTPFPMDMAILTQCRCLTVNYRKTLSHATAFPAPLLDVLAAYMHLTQTLEFAPSDVIILAESAGAHLALMLSQYLNDLAASGSSGSQEQKGSDAPQLPLLPRQPGCIILSSPWADFTLSYPSYESNAAYDQLVPIRLRRAVRSATRHYKPGARETRYFSPCKAEPEDWTYLLASKGKGDEGGQGQGGPRTIPGATAGASGSAEVERDSGTKVYVHYGGNELFRDEIVQLGRTMREAGVNIRLREDPEGLHTSGMIGSSEAGRIFRKDVLEMLEM